MTTLNLDIFGRDAVAEKDAGRWQLYWVGSDGTRSPLTELAIPAGVNREELIRLLDDFFHEWASPERPAVRVLSD